MISYAQLSPGRDWRPLRALLYYGYRVGSASPLGRTLANCIAAAISVRHPAPAALQADPLLEQLRRDGYAMAPSLLSDEQIKEMLAFLNGRTPVGDAALANYDLSDVVSCPHVLDLANHPRLLALAAAYLGCAPTISTIGIRWSYPSKKTATVQEFHRDPDDWKMVKFFAYLTDVAEGTGPHIFVAGSHREKAPFFAGRYSDKQVAEKYGEDALVTIQGRRGTMFLADTSGIHKGSAAVEGPRLMFEVGYTLLPCYAMEYRPAQAAARHSAHDPYINRLILARNRGFPSPAKVAKTPLYGEDHWLRDRP
jgi:hypothetical protein